MASQQQFIDVALNVYDVTNASSEGTNTAITRLNHVTRQMGLGGVFHGAVVVGSLEWSFGFCESGSGVYSCKPQNNPMYCFRETIPLGATSLSMEQIHQVLLQLRSEWSGNSYDLLARNCCHFCEEMAIRLDVAPIPGWLNRFAVGADATINFTQDAVTVMKGIGQELGRLSGESVGFVKSQWQKTFTPLQQQQQDTSSVAAEQEACSRGSSGPGSSSGSSQTLDGRQQQAGGSSSSESPKFALWNRNSGSGSNLVMQAGQGLKSILAQTREGLSRLQEGR